MNETAGTPPRNPAIIAGYCAVFLVSIMILTKAVAFFITDSTSILSSLMDSLLDSFISVTALASIYYANRPPDEDHRWGHGKMEAVSALFQAAIIAAAGAFVVFEATNRFFHLEPINNSKLAIGVMVLSIVLSLILVMIQRFALSKSNSLALEADHTHYSSDVVINVGVLIVLFAIDNGAPLWLDPLFAICVAFLLAYVAKNIGSKALNMLMDKELPDSERAKIINIIEQHKGVAGWHDLRMNLHGQSIIISFDIEVDGNLSLSNAHDIAKDLERKSVEIYPNAEILIHIDPIGDTEDTRHKVKGIHH